MRLPTTAGPGLLFGSSMSSSPPQLAINLIQLLPGRSGGIETYAKELLPRILDLLPHCDFTVFVNTEGYEAYPAWDARCAWEHVKMSWYDRPKRLLYESTVVPHRVRAHGCDLLHNMVNTACLRPGCPQVTTIFDATPQLFPEPGESFAGRTFRRLLQASVRRSDAIVTISQSAAQDISRAYGIAPGDIHVALLAARPPNAAGSRRQTGERFELPTDREYFITPAARRPHKNIARLVSALAELEADRKPLLVLPGVDAGSDAELVSVIDECGLADRVRLVGWVTDQELDSLYTHAVALVFPSLAEGFGLPVLEAMQCGCAVATSNVSSMPEVGGDAAIYFNPTSTSEIAAAMDRLLGDVELRTRLGKAGPAHAHEFSWERTAEQTVAVYRELATL